MDIILNNVFDALIACDKDGDVKLTDDEIDDLIHGIEGINKVDINDELSKRMIIDAGRDINAVMKLVKDVLDDDPTTGSVTREHVFTILLAEQTFDPAHDFRAGAKSRVRSRSIRMHVYRVPGHFPL